MHVQCNDAELFFKSLKDIPPVSIRINPEKSIPDASLKKVNWCNNGYYLEQRPSFTHDPLFHAGTYFVQEASSMFLEQYILQAGMHEQPITALDLCASPGGKSTHILSILHRDSLLISNETIRSRIPALKENIIKWGFPNCVITSNDPSAFTSLSGVFDLIVCDAPCSGEGMFRKDPASINHWSLEHVHHCAERQKRIVQQAWKALKPGGVFIYSTCTFNKEENENVLYSLLENGEFKSCIRLKTGGMDNIEVKEDDISIYRFYPHRINGEGITIAALIKSDNAESNESTHTKKAQSDFKISKQAPYWLNDENGKFYEMNSKLVFLKNNVSHFMSEKEKKLNMVYAGTETAEIVGNQLIPLHESCMSILYRSNSFPELELNRNDALKYLSGETHFNIDASDGMLLFTYQNKPLGFARKTGNRFNNHYPKGWRIRKLSREG